MSTGRLAPGCVEASWHSIGSVPSAPVTALSVVDGRLVIAGLGRAAILEPSGWREEDSMLPPVTRMVGSSVGQVLAGTDDGVFVRRGVDHWEWVLNCDGVSDILSFRDVDGLERWLVATAQDGILRGDAALTDWVSCCAGLVDLRVSALGTAGSGPRRVLLAGTASGLYGSGDDGRSWRRIRQAPQSEVLSLACWESGRIVALFATGELYVSDNALSWRVLELPESLEGAEFVRVLDDARAAVVHEDGRMYGVDPGQPAVLHELPRLPAAPCFDLALDPQGRLIAATAGGLHALEGSRWEAAGPERLGHGGARLVSPPQGGAALVCDLGGAVRVTSPDHDRLFAVARPGKALWDAAVTADGGIWVATGRGLRRLEDQTWRDVPGPAGIQRLFATGDRLFAETESARLFVREVVPGSTWTEVPAVPVRPHRIVESGRLVAAATIARDGGVLRSTIWLAERDIGHWRPVLAAPTTAPIAVAPDASDGFVIGAGQRILHLGPAAGVEPRSLVDPTHDDGPALVLDLVGHGHSLIAHTPRGLWWSGDEGRAWIALPSQHRPIAIAHAGLSILALTDESRVWVLDANGLAPALPERA